MQATPSTWRLLVESGWEGKADLKILCGGEAMPGELASELLPRCAELWNMYGPTETTVWSTAARIETGQAHQAAIDHRADAVDGQAGLGDGGRQYNLTLPLSTGCDGQILLLCRESAIERDQCQGVGQGTVFECLQGALDLAAAGQKAE